MVLRGKKPEQIGNPRLKLLLFGEEGVGKTMAAIQMPAPYLIDTEKGSVYYGDIIKKSGGSVFQTTSMAETIEEVRSLMTEKHDYKTLVIDPFTTLYDTELEIGAAAEGTDFGRHYGFAAKASKRLYHLLTQLDMNIIMTAHAKNEYGEGMKVIGKKADGWKKLPYLFDLVLYLERRHDDDRTRLATVMKTRLPQFPDQSKFPWSYDALVERYGKDNMERQAKQVDLASGEQVEQFNALMAKLSEAEIKRLKIDKVLKSVDDVADLPAERIAAGIGHITDYLKSSAAA